MGKHLKPRKRQVRKPLQKKKLRKNRKRRRKKKRNLEVEGQEKRKKSFKRKFTISRKKLTPKMMVAENLRKGVVIQSELGNPPKSQRADQAEVKRARLKRARCQP